MATLEEYPPRFQKVARRVGKGWTYAETAHDLDLTVRTVERYIHQLAAEIIEERPDLAGLRPKDRVMRWWAVDVEGNGE